MWSESQPTQACVKQEPDRDEETSGGEPRPQRPVSAEHVQVKEEVVEYLKEESEWEDSAAFHGKIYGVGESGALGELYAGHEVKDELVLGPERLQPTDIVFKLYAAQALNVKEQRVPRDCAVRLERVEHVEALLKSKTHSNTNIATDRDTYVCDVCEKRFALKTQLMEHAMIHIRQSSEREGTRADNGEEVDVKSEPADDDGASDNSLGEEPGVKSEPADDDGASDDSLGEEPDVKSAPADDDGASDSLVDSGSAAALSACSLSARARQQLAMTCSVRLERLRDEDHEHTCDTSAKQLTRKPTPLTLQEHTHTAYSCDICSKTFPRKSLFTKHVRTHDVKKPYARDLYNKHFIEKEKKRGLVKHNHINTGYNYICDICNKQFSQRGALNRHVRIHTGQKPFSCDICNKQFSQRGALNRHVRIHTGQKPFSCDICNKQYSQKGDLNRHVRIHTGLKLYTCDLCNKQFPRKSHLQNHVRIHTGQKPYTCDICNKQFIHKGDLNKHVRIHTGLKPYKCDMCNKKFSQNSHLQNHVRIHTGQKPYTCDICNKQFYRKSHLQTHVRIHTGLKPYTCDICNKQFSQKGDLNRHVRIHTGLKPYKCDICNKQFTEKGTLNKHVRIHSRHTLA